jgi:hypothetical protein
VYSQIIAITVVEFPPIKQLILPPPFMVFQDVIKQATAIIHQFNFFQQSVTLVTFLS